MSDDKHAKRTKVSLVIDLDYAKASMPGLSFLHRLKDTLLLREGFMWEICEGPSEQRQDDLMTRGLDDIVSLLMTGSADKAFPGNNKPPIHWHVAE